MSDQDVFVIVFSVLCMAFRGANISRKRKLLALKDTTSNPPKSESMDENLVKD